MVTLNIIVQVLCDLKVPLTTINLPKILCNAKIYLGYLKKKLCELIGGYTENIFFQILLGIFMN